MNIEYTKNELICWKMTFNESESFFENADFIKNKNNARLWLFCYVTLGQQSTTLSGGEAQRD